MDLVLRRTAVFIAIILAWALFAASAARSATADREVVAFSGFKPGTIVVKTNERRLYFVLNKDKALRFPVGVGKTGWRWSGRAVIEGKFVKPAWKAPPELAHGRDAPVIPGGAPQNPMGVAALTMRNGEYAIHGTNNPGSIGGFVSHGCIRMHNADVLDLYRRVPLGSGVYVLQ
jgi:lipoprotein-anchoring transpeptidase ErfK/SrfK